MAIEQALYTHLAGTAAIASLVGTRISPVERKQTETLPAIVYYVTDAELQQVSCATATLQRTGVSIEVYATTYTGVKTLLDAVIDALNIGESATWGSLTVQAVNILEFSDGWEEERPGGEGVLHAARLLVDIWHTAS